MPWRPTSAARRSSLKLDSDSGECAHSIFPCLFLPACIMQQIRNVLTFAKQDSSLHPPFHTHCRKYEAARAAAAAAGPGSIRRFRNSKLFSNSLRGPGLSSAELTPSGNQITPRGANALFCFCVMQAGRRQARVWFTGLMQVMTARRRDIGLE